MYFFRITMSGEDAHSVIINISQPRAFTEVTERDLKNKGLKQRVCENAFRKPSKASLRKYLLTGSKPIHLSSLKNDDFLLPYKLYAKEQDIIDRKQRLGITLDEKYKFINTDLRKRLYVEDPPDDVKAVSDIDDDYFRYFKRHHLTKYIPLYKALRFQFHKCVRMRHEAGFLRDSVLLIEVNHRKELQAYELSVLKCAEQAKLFGVLISEDYKKSIACLKKSDDLVAIVNEKELELEHLANKLFLIQSTLIGLDYLYFMQQKYGRFLYSLSPTGWRAKHREFARSVEIEAKGFDLGHSSEDTFNVIFEKMQNECFGGLIQPVLYFTHPDELMSVFEGVQKQQLYHLSHLTQLDPLTKILKETLKKLKSSVDNDSAFMALIIKDIKNFLDLLALRESQLQAKFMKILHGLFYHCVGATDVLKLKMYLEFCYENLYADKPTNMSIMSTAKAIENMYMEYSFKLDACINDDIKLAMKQSIENEKRTLNRAYMASRDLHLFARLENSMLRACEKVKTYEVPLPPVFRRPSLHKPQHRSHTPIQKNSKRELTEAEVDYLCMFTDWTEKEDPADYLHR